MYERLDTKLRSRGRMTTPAPLFHRPLITLNSAVFPAPLGPITRRPSPAGHTMLTPPTIVLVLGGMTQMFFSDSATSSEAMENRMHPLAPRAAFRNFSRGWSFFAGPEPLLKTAFAGSTSSCSAAPVASAHASRSSWKRLRFASRMVSGSKLSTKKQATFMTSSYAFWTRTASPTPSAPLYRSGSMQIHSTRTGKRPRMAMTEPNRICTSLMSQKALITLAYKLAERSCSQTLPPPSAMSSAESRTRVRPYRKSAPTCKTRWYVCVRLTL
mmetsp:Transcript_114837/g.325261  ORF Transcript_114837/g.325261 Transcript_114837/m.325261 type:complete len:270 (+) Transcript_114837:584-1393(+)